MSTWTKLNTKLHEATINGRTFCLRHNRKTRTRTVHVVCASWQKYRRSTTHTWYSVVEKKADGTCWDYTSIFQGQMTAPGTLAAAKSLAQQIASR